MNKLTSLNLTALLLAPLAALHAGRNLPGVPRVGKLRVGNFQALETFGAMASSGWNLGRTIPRKIHPIIWLSRFSAWFVLSAFAARGAVDFEKDVRPVLAERCVECHGEKKQKADLRLDAKRFAFKGSENGAVIVAGDSAKSPLFQRIVTEDEDERMPPKGDALTKEQVAAIKAWIDTGAVWPESDADKAAAHDKRLEHWSVLPVKKTVAATGGRGDAEKNPIDGFVRAKLEASGLAMSGEADRRTLIRRLSFDLHGMPPSPQRVEQFAADADPKAYEKLVDELLAAPQYGERWARHWLDIAHYADTHGFERDQLRPNAWRYRDYVIRSLNADKRYDEFLREQIAGDVIAPDDPRAVTATGFLAAGPWDFVGHVETKSDMLKRAARAGDLDDMVTQVISATMGITINCARCHDHKIDPISQKEYYSLWAVFAGVKRGERDVNAAESKRLRETTAQLNRDLAAARSELGRVTGAGLDLADIVGGGDGLGSGVKNRGIDPSNGKVVTEKLGYHRDNELNELRPVVWPEGAKVPGFVKWVFIPDGRVEVPVDEAVVVRGVPTTSGLAWDAIRNGPLNAQRTTKINGVDYAGKGHSILGLHANAGITFDLAKIRAAQGFKSMKLSGVAAIGAQADAAGAQADLSVFVDEELRFQKLKLKKAESAVLDVLLPESAKTVTLVATDGEDGISSDLLFIGDARIAPDINDDKLAEAQKARAKDLRAKIAKLEGELRALPAAPKVYGIVSDALPPIVHVQRRGNPEDEGAEVAPGSFGWVRHAKPSFGDNNSPEGVRRRALADWITHPENPLTRRVIVNRLWHHHFGRGIVSTPSDFGLGGDRPSHPELLDWLATEFERGGWSLKHMHRLMVTSAAYRQQSTTRNKDAEKTDAGNRLLWRQNPRRLDAESLRDAVLVVSGRLNPEMGGPGFRDFNYTEAYAPIYTYITPDRPELWRRSIYRFVVRTTPHEFMSTLDCPDPANLTPARVQTTTALQALALSNNGFMLQQARHLATRIESETDDPTSAIRRAFSLAFQRAPDDAELRAAMKLVNSQGLFALCRTLLNANEFVYLD